MKKVAQIIFTMIISACMAYIILLASQYWQARRVLDDDLMFVYGLDLMVFALVSLSVIIMTAVIFANHDDDDKKGKKKK